MSALNTFFILGDIVQKDDPAFDSVLAKAYAGKERPICMCASPGVAMYIAKINDKFFIKRMPNTGPDHAPACESYEPPPELSGLGEVSGTAIAMDIDGGATVLRVGFPLLKMSGKTAPTPSGTENKVAKADDAKLTVRATLHHVWEQAGFNRWYPKMAGKRHWWLIRKHFLRVADETRCKGELLSSILYMPSEPHDKNSEPERIKAMQTLRQMFYRKMPKPGAKSRDLLLMIAELDHASTAVYGAYLFPKFWPNPSVGFVASAETFKRIQNRFKTELAFGDQYKDQGVKIIMICTFFVDETCQPHIQELSLINTTANYVPFDSIEEMELIDAMTRAGRSFYKGLRYNVPLSKPMAALVATDTSDGATAMYITSPQASEEYIALQEKLIAGSKLPHWIWNPAEGVMPPLPAPDTSRYTAHIRA